jgi:hypothetical protein
MRREEFRAALKQGEASRIWSYTGLYPDYQLLQSCQQRSPYVNGPHRRL